MSMLKIVFLFFAVYYSIVNFGLMHYKQNVPSVNIFIQSASIVGFLALQFSII